MKFRAGKAVAILGCRDVLDMIVASVDVGPHGKLAGVDPAVDLVADARQQVDAKFNDKLMPQIQLITAPLEQLPLPDAAFDYVLCNSLASLAEERKGALREIRRILRKGGRAIFREVLLNCRLPAALRNCLKAPCRMVSQAVSEQKFRAELEGANLREITVTATKMDLNNYLLFEITGGPAAPRTPLTSERSKSQVSEGEDIHARIRSVLSRFNVNDFASYASVSALALNPVTHSNDLTRVTSSSRPTSRNRKVTTDTMLDLLRLLLNSPAPKGAKRGHWTIEHLAKELASRGVQCSMTTVAQALRLIKRERVL